MKEQEEIRNKEDEIKNLNKYHSVFPEVIEEDDIQFDDSQPTETKENEQPSNLQSFTESETIEEILSLEALGYDDDEEIYDMISTQKRRVLKMKKHQREKRKKKLRTYLKKLK